jgi:tRNA (guanine37-N1)-methyltransferase
MRYSVITLFPNAVLPYSQASIVGKACEKGVISVEAINPRDFVNTKHKKVDDTPYGGGPGMVMMAEPLVDAYESLLPLVEPSVVLLTSPGGRLLTDAWARELATLQHVVILCGHYEGIDARIHPCIPN